MVNLVVNRAVPLIDLIKGKSVLEFGCVGLGKEDTIGGQNFIAGKIKPFVSNWCGIDINKKGVEILKKNGFNAFCFDLEKPFNLNQKFDIILVEEVIEHITEFKPFFQNIHTHLKVGGKVIFTTPNPISHSFFIQRFLSNRISDVSVNRHTHWHTPETLSNLLKKYKFIPLKIKYIHPMPVRRTLFYKLVIIPIWRIIPDQFGRNFIMVATNVQGK